jgi:hypothetical protein
VGVAITPDHVTAVTVARGWRRRVKDQQRVSCDSAPAERNWKSAIGALQMLLPAIDSRSGSVTVALSNRFVRYVIVPWQDQLAGADMEAAFARHCFRQVYGAAADAWEIRVSSTPPGHPRIASAVDAELIRELREAFAGSGLKIRSIQPYLMAAYNKWRRKLDTRGCLFMLAEERFYTCMAFARGKCEAVHSGAFEEPLTQALPVILDREFVRSGMEERPSVFVYAPEQPAVSVSQAGSWSAGSRHLRDEAGIAASLDPVFRSAVLAL